MEADLIVGHITIKGTELSVSTSRSSGPGGQHVNKTSSRVSLRWDIASSTSITDCQKALIMERLKPRLVGQGELLIHVESERSQQRNREVARERLKDLVKRALEPKKKRVSTSPTKSSKQQRISSKKRRGVLKKLRKLQKDFE